jgi:NAD+ kinase
MKTIGVIANCRKPHSAEMLGRLVSIAREHQLNIVSCDESPDLNPAIRRVEQDELGKEIDLLVALGGDGTVLRSIRLLNDSETPVLGVNIGSLGFMTSVPERELESALESVREGNYSISIRAIIACRLVRNEKIIGEYQALNDIAIGWGLSSRVVTLGLSINWEDVASFVCDGLILSTPTGSTGHSLSAGGPIIHPESNTFVINPICPHTLSNRPLVVPDSCEVAVKVIHADKNLLLSADGQGNLTLESGDLVRMEKSANVARLIRLPGYSYFSLLRHKLHWRGSSVD